MIAPRRTKEFLYAVLVWTSVLATAPDCLSFSFSPNAARTEKATRVGTCSGAEGRGGSVITALHAGPLVEELETTDASSEGGANDCESLVSADDSSSANGALSSLSSWFPENRQVLEFVEPQTNVTVMLIGSMHYNPASIELVEKTVDELGATNKLGSVIIESCDIRWNKTQEMMDRKKSVKIATPSSNGAEQSIENNPNEKDFLGNEMRAAWEVATKYYRPTVLGDQQINATMDALKASLKETASDIFLGGPSGWKRSAEEIAVNWKKTIPVSAGENNNDDINDNSDETRYLNAFAFFDPRLLISLPVSLVKYPVSFLVKDPIPVGTVFAIIAFLNFYADVPTGDFSFEEWFAAATTPRDYPLSDYVFSVLIAFLETVVFARLLLKPLLADRNEILARSVLDQCLIYANDDSTNGSNGQTTENKLPFGNWFQKLVSPLSPTDASAPSTGEEAPVYVPGSDPESMNVAAALASAQNAGSSNSEGKVVVAVLGMAHCNGVMKLLREQKV